MKNRTKQFGLTIIEILVVVAVIAILVTITVGITSRVDTAIKERKTRAAIDLLATALEKYYQFWKEFPLDKERLSQSDVIDETYDLSKLEQDLNGTVSAPALHFNEATSIEGLYYCLHRTPVCRDIVEKMDRSLVTSKGTDKSTYLFIKVNSKDYPLYRIKDAWGKPLKYLYDRDKDSFPKIVY